jgi:hypothetical protein
VSAEHFNELPAVHIWKTLQLRFLLPVLSIRDHSVQRLKSDTDHANLTQSLNLLAWLQSHALDAGVQNLGRFEVSPAESPGDGFGAGSDLVRCHREGNVAWHNRWHTLLSGFGCVFIQ